MWFKKLRFWNFNLFGRNELNVMIHIVKNMKHKYLIFLLVFVHMYYKVLL